MNVKPATTGATPRYPLDVLEAVRDRKIAEWKAALAIKTTSGFVRYFWHKVGKGHLAWNWHHEIVCNEVDAVFAEADRRRELHDSIMAECANRREAEARIAVELAPLDPLVLVVEVPPRSLKSTILSKCLPGKRWLLHPEEQFLALSSSDSNVIRDGLALRDIVESEEYKFLISQVVAADLLPARYHPPGVDGDKWHFLREDQRAKGKFNTSAGGSRQGVSIGSRFTGADSDVTVIDDPHDIDDAMSGTPEQTERRMMEDVGTYKTKIEDRQNHPLWHVTLAILQPVHLLDLGAYLAEQGARVIRFAAEFDPEDPYNHPDDPRTMPGELLDPIRLPREVLDRKRHGGDGESEYAFNTKYLMKRTARTGGKIEASWFTQRYTCRPEDIATAADEVWITVDSNVKGGAGHDDTAIQAWALKGGLRYLLSRIARPMSPIEHDQTIDDEIAHWLAHIRARPRSGVLIEDAANGAQYLQTRRSLYPFLVAFSPGQTPGKDKSKAARADYFIRAAESGAVVLPDSSVCPWVGGFVERLVGWPMVGRDEMDAASQLHMRWTVGEDEMPVVVHSGFVDARNRFAR